MKKSKTKTSILFWYGMVDEKGEVVYRLKFEGKEDIVNYSTADAAMDNARVMNYPIVCIN